LAGGHLDQLLGPHGPHSLRKATNRALKMVTSEPENTS
jgi:hypothetical protein